MKLNSNLFDLTGEQIELSKTIYDGKVIKCIIAPHHTFAQLEKIIPFTKTTYLFPEREMTIQQSQNLISMIVASKSNDEFRIITKDTNIITNMIDGCVKVLSEDNELHDCPVKTFAQNIHTVKWEILDNERYRTSKKERDESNKKINILIDKINDKKPITQKEFDDIKMKISIIGEPLIERKLYQQLEMKTVIGRSKDDLELESLQRRLAELEKIKAERDKRKKK